MRKSHRWPADGRALKYLAEAAGCELLVRNQHARGLARRHPVVNAIVMMVYKRLLVAVRPVRIDFGEAEQTITCLFVASKPRTLEERALGVEKIKRNGAASEVRRNSLPRPAASETVGRFVLVRQRRRSMHHREKQTQKRNQLHWIISINRTDVRRVQ